MPANPANADNTRKPRLSFVKKLRASYRKRLFSLWYAWRTFTGHNHLHPPGSRRPTRVAFLCHMPALWSKLQPIYDATRDADDFEPVVVAAHRDKGVREETARFLLTEGITVMGGAKEPSTALEDFRPDYVFHSVPYEHFYPDHLQAPTVWRYARLCYVPYVGQLIYGSGVAKTTHHASYFRILRLAFLADEWEKARLLENCSWTDCGKVVRVVGSPHAERVLAKTRTVEHKVSRRPKVLWTPRWNTSEGNCHFFDHKDLLLEMSERGEIEFTFRPHPLCLPNLLKTGELTQAEHDRYRDRIARCTYASLDEGDYLRALAEHEVFVSDMSSVLGDAFLTGKPVVYTHRVDHFNELGRFMAEGFYWARTPAELTERLRKLAEGDDPLLEKRRSLLAEFGKISPAGATQRILADIRSDRVLN